MNRTLVRQWTIIGALAILLTVSSVVLSQAVAQESPTKRIMPRELAQRATAGYWLGVRCMDAGDRLTPKVVVKEIIPDAPAANAGVQAGDQIVAVNQVELSSVEHLAKIVRGSKGTALTLTLARADQELNVEVEPAERPTIKYNMPRGMDPDELADWIQQQARGGLGPGINLRLVNPGIIVPSRQPEIPAGTEFVIKKIDDQVCVVVRRESDEWIVSAETIQEMPPEIRRWALQLQNLVAGRYALLHTMPSGLNVLMPPPFTDNNSDRTQVESLQKRIQELQDTIKRLQSEAPKP